MTIEVSSSPSASARYTGSSACLACHADKRHWQQTAHKLGWTVPDAPGPLQDFARHPEYFNALAAFPAVDDYRRGTRLELGDYDASRNDDKFSLRAFGDARVPIDTPYADVYLWRRSRRRQVRDHDGQPAERAGSEQPRAPRDQAPVWRGRARPALHRLGPPGLGRSSGLVHRPPLQHDRAGQPPAPGTAGLARLQVLHVVVGRRRRQVRQRRRRPGRAAGQHQRRADHVCRLPPHRVGALSGHDDRPVSRAGGQRSGR